MSESFETVTEVPGYKAHRLQLDILRTRYHWAAEFCEDKDVIEIACGAGLGLGMLEVKARSLIGGDVDPKVLRHAENHYSGRLAEVKELDACAMNLPDRSADVMICFEALYYFPSVEQFIAEAKRVLRPGGVLLCSSVNREWHGFNASPFSRQYLSLDELQGMLRKGGFSSDSYVGFEDNPDRISRKCISLIRSVASALHLVPKTMRGKELLKKIFYGQLVVLPNELVEGYGEVKELLPYEQALPLRNFRFFYTVSRNGVPPGSDGSELPADKKK